MFSIHTLASPSGRNVNYGEKQLTGKKILSCSFYLYRFRKYVSYGFPIIDFCNSGEHYETRCIKSTKGTQILFELYPTESTVNGRNTFKMGHCNTPRLPQILHKMRHVHTSRPQLANHQRQVHNRHLPTLLHQQVHLYWTGLITIWAKSSRSKVNFVLLTPPEILLQDKLNR